MPGRPDGKLVFGVGASRSGKTQTVLVEIRNTKRCIVWDVEGEFAANHGMRVIEGREALFRFVRSKAARGNFKIAYHPKNLKEFDFFCRCAFILGVMGLIDIVCEELAASTNAVKAQGYWGVLVSRGLKYGINIYGIAQRGQEIDNSLIGNATITNICRPNTVQDAEYIAGKFGLKLSDIPDTDLEVLQRHKDRSLKKKKISFRNGKPLFKPILNFTKTY